MQKIRVLIADDHLIVREGLRLILDTSDEFELVGEAEDGSVATRLALELKPDVILMDLRMPHMDGLEALRQINAQLPESAVVILTNYNEDDLMVRGLSLGARSYLLKDVDRDMLFNTIRAAQRGETLLQPDILVRVLACRQAAQQGREPGGLKLTAREQEVLQAVARGERSKEIAARLHITERTVKAHLDSIYNKLGVDSRAAAVEEAHRRGIL
jgi:NarL family two-component system response regulator YdfI